MTAATPVVLYFTGGGAHDGWHTDVPLPAATALTKPGRFFGRHGRSAYRFIGVDQAGRWHLRYHPPTRDNT